MKNGVLVIDKPQDYTSFDVVAVLRRLLGQKKIGHTGTLDPMATGVLPMLVGTATRAQSLAPDTDKEYLAHFQLGLTTDTQDSTGKILAQSSVKEISRAALEQALEQFRGEIMQVPPMFSAVQKDGVRLYDLARRGIEIEREARPVTIRRLVLEEYQEERGSGVLRVSCSKGTYIRTLCHDLGQALGCGGIMTALRRTAACGFLLKESITLEQAKELAQQGTLQQRILSTEGLFQIYPSVQVTQAQAVRFCNGGGLLLERLRLGACKAEQIYRVHSPQGEFLGLGIVALEKAELSVLKLFALQQQE